jgi:hypothetical protein
MKTTKLVAVDKDLLTWCKNWGKKQFPAFNQKQAVNAILSDARKSIDSTPKKK